MLRVGKQVLGEVNDAVRRSSLQRLAKGGNGRVLVSAYQTQTRRSVGDAEIHALLGRTMGVAVIGAAALSFGIDSHGNATAHARAAIPLPRTSQEHTSRKRTWHLFDQIGSGSFGTVRIGMCETSGEVAAIKIVEPERYNFTSLEREIGALKLVKALGGHRNIIDIKDVYIDGRKVYLAMELVRGGELFEHVVANGPFSEREAGAIARDIGDALSFLHRHGLVHRDIKPENILLTSRASEPTNLVNEPFVKLADFGSAGPASTTVPLDDVGTSAYLPPELLSSNVCSPACDMWALGCVLYISLCGAHPFDIEGTASDDEVELRVHQMPVAFDFEPWNTISPQAKDLIIKLLHKDPSQRLTADQLLVHPWITAQCSQMTAPLAPTHDVVARTHV